MSGTYNKVVLVGRLGKDPEKRYTQNGTPVANMNMATNEVYFDREGTRQERTDWHRVVVWDKQAESVSNYLSKGSMALVEGSLQTRKWQDDQGQNRYITEVRAQRVVFMGRQSDAAVKAPGAAPAQEGVEESQDPFAFSEGSEEFGPAFPSEAGSMDDAPF